MTDAYTVMNISQRPAYLRQAKERGTVSETLHGLKSITSPALKV